MPPYWVIPERMELRCGTLFKITLIPTRLTTNGAQHKGQWGFFSCGFCPHKPPFQQQLKQKIACEGAVS